MPLCDFVALEIPLGYTSIGKLISKKFFCLELLVFEKSYIIYIIH